MRHGTYYSIMHLAFRQTLLLVKWVSCTQRKDERVFRNLRALRPVNVQSTLYVQNTLYMYIYMYIFILREAQNRFKLVLFVLFILCASRFYLENARYTMRIRTL